MNLKDVHEIEKKHYNFEKSSWINFFSRNQKKFAIFLKKSQNEKQIS